MTYYKRLLLCARLNRQPSLDFQAIFSIFAHYENRIKINPESTEILPAIGEKKYRQSEKMFIAEGVHLIREIMQSDWNLIALLHTNDFLNKSEPQSIINKALERGIQIHEIQNREFSKFTNTVTTQGIVGIVEEKPMRLDHFIDSLPSKYSIVALDSISDPGNAGTIIRTCDWFGVDGILMDRNTVELYNPKVLRSTMGSIFHLPIFTDVDIQHVASLLRKDGAKIIITLLRGGEPMNKFSFPEKSIVVFGNEAHGVSSNFKQSADLHITIPKHGKAESLNVAISCGIILEYMKTRASKPLS